MFLYGNPLQSDKYPENSPWQRRKDCAGSGENMEIILSPSRVGVEDIGRP